MKNKVLELEKSIIEPCESIIIKDPWYEKGTWCAFQEDNCKCFTHAKALVSNYDEHYKDDQFEFDMNNTEFALVIGVDDFVSRINPRINEDGSIAIYAALNEKTINSSKTEIACDTAQFGFGNENTFGAFSIHTGADGRIGEVHLYMVKGTKVPVGLFFVGSVDGDMVPPEEIMDSFKAAFGIEKERKPSLQNTIDEAEKKKSSVVENGAEQRENIKDS